MMLFPNYRADPFDIALGGTLHRRFGVRGDEIVPPAAVETVEGKRFDRLEDAFDGSFVQGNHVGITVHETDVAPILRHLHCVAGEQRAASFRALRPVQYIRALEVTATADQREALQDGVCLAFPKDEGRVGAHDPLTVVRVPIDGRAVEGLTPFHQ